MAALSPHSLAVTDQITGRIDAVKMHMTGQHGRTEGVSDTCEYGGRCGKPAAGELRAHQMTGRDFVPWAMCATHVKPEAHPRDLHNRLVRW